MYALAVDHVEPDPDAGTDNDNRAGYSHTDLPNAGNVHARGDARAGNTDPNTRHANPDDANEPNARDTAHADNPGDADDSHHAAAARGVTTAHCFR